MYEYVSNTQLGSIDPSGLDGLDIALNPASGEAIEAAEAGETTEEFEAAQAAKNAAQKSANDAKRLSDNQLAKNLKCQVKDIEKIKDVVKTQFKDKLQKAGIKNPDLSINDSGNLVLKWPVNAPGLPVSIPQVCQLQIFLPDDIFAPKVFIIWTDFLTDMRRRIY